MGAPRLTGFSGEDTSKGRLQRAVYALLLEHEARGELPTSLRFLFYELVMARVLDKDKKRGRGSRGSDQDLADAVTHLRNVGLVPWQWIVDETRSVTAFQYAATAEEWLLGSLARMRLGSWGGALPPLIICESRTFGGVLTRTVAAEYLCPVAPTNGQARGFLHTDVAPLLTGNARQVLYVGDLDLSGGQIEANTRQVLEDVAGRAIEWRRVALTAEQVQEHHLLSITKVDGRYGKDNPKRWHEAVEVEALGQGVVTAMVRGALEGLLPAPLAAVRDTEEAEAAWWRAFIEEAARIRRLGPAS